MDLLDMLPLLTAFVIVLVVVVAPKGGDEQWKRFSNDPRQQTKTFADRVLRGITPKR